MRAVALGLAIAACGPARRTAPPPTAAEAAATAGVPDPARPRPAHEHWSDGASTSTTDRGPPAPFFDVPGVTQVIARRSHSTDPDGSGSSEQAEISRGGRVVCEVWLSQQSHSGTGRSPGMYATLRLRSRDPLVFDAESRGDGVTSCTRYQIDEAGPCRVVRSGSCTARICTAVVTVTRRPGTGPIDGVVTADGELVVGQAVAFTSTTATTDARGRFVVRPRPGPERVRMPKFLDGTLDAAIPMAADQDASLAIRFDDCACCDHPR